MTEKQAPPNPNRPPKRYLMCICGHIRGEHRDEGFEGCIFCECVSFAETHPQPSVQHSSAEDGRS